MVFSLYFPSDSVDPLFVSVFLPSDSAYLPLGSASHPLVGYSLSTDCFPSDYSILVDFPYPLSVDYSLLVDFPYPLSVDYSLLVDSPYPLSVDYSPF